VWKPLRFIYTPTLASKNELSPALSPRTPDQDDIDPPTSFSPSLKGYDYADYISAKSLISKGLKLQLGIIRYSA
jgi:hypothetical protein